MFDVADIWATRTGEEVRLVSANDHIHARASAHYSGMAVDLHSSANQRLADMLRQLGYFVLWNVPGHFGHVHVEAADALRVSRPPRVEPRTLPATALH
jgi:hypothetical protein